MTSKVDERASRMLAGIERGLKARWDALRTEAYAPGEKGRGYEIAAGEWFDTYLGGQLEFHNRAALVDRNLSIFDRMTANQNEWDVVATYKGALPRIVHEIQNLKQVALDSVFFVAEVKKVATAPFVEKDLAKMSKLNGLETGRQIIPGVINESSMDRVVKLLLYQEREVSDDSLAPLLIKSMSNWDLLLFLDEDLLLVNSALKVSTKLAGSGSKDDLVSPIRQFPLTQLILLLSLSMNAQCFVSTTGTWTNLLHRAIGVDRV